MTETKDTLASRLGHVFQDESLLARALTHASIDSANSNERLEFFGDRVLGLVIAEKLYAQYPSETEGALTVKFHSLARRETCAEAAEAAGLGEYLKMAKSEAASGGRRKTIVLAGVCEAIIAALYLDGGYEVARAFIERYWQPAFARLSDEMRDAKTILQVWAQARRDTPVYTVVSREGPDHAPRFVVEVKLKDDKARAEGNTKREAEQAAARILLARVDPPVS